MNRRDGVNGDEVRTQDVTLIRAAFAIILFLIPSWYVRVRARLRK